MLTLINGQTSRAADVKMNSLVCKGFKGCDLYTQMQPKTAAQIQAHACTMHTRTCSRACDCMHANVHIHDDAGPHAADPWKGCRGFISRRVCATVDQLN